MKSDLKIVDTKYAQFESTDGLLLPGMLFEPKTSTNKVALNLHGNGSSSVFYSFERADSFARNLNEKGISFFTFNNRGAHYIKKLKYFENGEEKEIKLGTAFELIKDCVKDIDGAIAFLKKLGYREFYLIGHSTGANKICVYNYYKPKNEVSKYILLGGGDDAGIYYKMLGENKFKKYLELAKRQIDKGNGRKIIPKYIANYMLSYQSFYDTCNPDGDYNTFPFNEYINHLNLSTKPLFKEYKLLNTPTLVIYGENDEYCGDSAKHAIDILKTETPHKDLFTFKIIPQTDHGFDGCQEELSSAIANWLIK